MLAGLRMALHLAIFRFAVLPACAEPPEKFVNRTLLQSTLRELQSMLGDPRLWLVFLAIVALFAVTGPFGTYAYLPLHSRVGYWLLVQSMAWAFALLFIAVVEAAFADAPQGRLTRMLAAAALASLPMGAAITVVNSAVFSAPVTGAEFAENLSTTLPAALAISLLSYLARFGGVAVPPVEAQTPAPAFTRPVLLDRLPPEKRGPLLRIEVQDHYVLVVTARGREMLLMRLADAIRETAPADGMQVHRSHWVAREAVREIVREQGKNGRTLVRTVDGVTVPISRGNVAEVRAWVDAGAA